MRSIRRFALFAIALSVTAAAHARIVVTPPWLTTPTDPTYTGGKFLHVQWEFTQSPTTPVSQQSNFTFSPDNNPRFQFIPPGTYPDVVPGPDGNPIPTWHVDQDGILVITLPNNPPPLPDKYIILQITSDKAPGTPLETDPLHTGVPGDNTVTAGFPGASAWYTYVFEWHLRPNPPFEIIEIPVIQSTNIEEIVIDTICVPEPASGGVLLLGTSAIVAGSRGRRSRR